MFSIGLVELVKFFDGHATAHRLNCRVRLLRDNRPVTVELGTENYGRRPRVRGE